MTMRPILLILLALPLLAGCRAKEPPPRAPVSRPAEIQGWEAGLAATGAELVVEGSRKLSGPVSFRCVLHDEAGLQVNFRTGDPALPAVAVRIDAYREGGPYPGQLFLTARSGTGALVTSRGDVELRIAQQSPEPSAAPGAETVLQVSGSFKGTYRGAAGSGSITGRFGECFYSRVRGVAASPGPGPLPQPAPAAGGGIGEDVSMP
jgi:hypothetical protein